MEIVYDVNPSHFATCDLPITACRPCSQEYGLQRADELAAEIAGLESQIAQRRAAIARILERTQ